MSTTTGQSISQTAFRAALLSAVQYFEEVTIACVLILVLAFSIT
jgi:hypothetical protein